MSNNCDNQCPEEEQNCVPLYCEEGCAIDVNDKCVHSTQIIECLDITQADTQKTINSKLAAAICDFTNDGDDKYVRISANDTTSGYLSSKLEAGNNVTLVPLYSGLNEKIRIDVSGAGTSPNLVLSSSDDTIQFVQSGTQDHTANIRTKISSKAGNALTVITTPSGEKGLFTPVETYMVKVDANDTPDYLETQIEIVPDALGIISFTKSVVAGKLRFTPVFDLQKLCTELGNIDCINSNCEDIIISSHPENPYIINEGDTLYLSVSVSAGSTPITYQWQHQVNSVWVNIGTNSSSYSKANAQYNDDAGAYRVTLTNNCSSVISNVSEVAIEPISNTFTAYWGWKDTIDPLTSGQIVTGNSGSFSNGATIGANYNANSEPKYLWMAEPVAQPAKTKWDGTGGGFPNGSIGGTSGVTSNTFADPTVISSTYRFYITEYPTQSDGTNLTNFKVS